MHLEKSITRLWCKHTLLETVGKHISNTTALYIILVVQLLFTIAYQVVFTANSYLHLLIESLTQIGNSFMNFIKETAVWVSR